MIKRISESSPYDEPRKIIDFRAKIYIYDILGQIGFDHILDFLAQEEDLMSPRHRQLLFDLLFPEVEKTLYKDIDKEQAAEFFDNINKGQ